MGEIGSTLKTTQRTDLFAVLAVNRLFGREDTQQCLGGLALVTLNNINKNLTGIVDDGESVSNLLIKISIFFAKNPEMFDEFMGKVKSIEAGYSDIDLISKFLADKITNVALEHREIIEKYQSENKKAIIDLKYNSNARGLDEIETRIRNNFFIQKANTDIKER